MPSTLANYQAGRTQFMQSQPQVGGGMDFFDAILAGNPQQMQTGMANEAAYMNSLSPAQRAEFQGLAQADMNSGFGGIMRKYVKPLARMAALSPLAIGAAGATGLLSGTAFGTEAGFGAAAGAESIGPASSFGAGSFSNPAYVSLPEMSAGLGTEASAGFSGLGAGGFNNPAYVSMPDVPGGMLSGQFNNPAYVNIPGMEGGNLSPSNLGLGGAGAEGGASGREQPSSFSSAFDGGFSGIMSRLSNFGPGGFGTPAARTIAGLFGLMESQRLKKMMQLPDPSDVTRMPGYEAGMEAVRRSMASQGYQGSGNMMAALHKYGGDMYNQYVGQRMNSAQGQAGGVYGGLSSMALLANGLGGFYGR